MLLWMTRTLHTLNLSFVVTSISRVQTFDPDNFQNFVGTSVSSNTSLVKYIISTDDIQWCYIIQILTGAEVNTEKLCHEVV